MVSEVKVSFIYPFNEESLIIIFGNVLLVRRDVEELRIKKVVGNHNILSSSNKTAGNSYFKAKVGIYIVMVKVVNVVAGLCNDIPFVVQHANIVNGIKVFYVGEKGVLFDGLHKTGISFVVVVGDTLYPSYPDDIRISRTSFCSFR